MRQAALGAAGGIAVNDALCGGLVQPFHGGAKLAVGIVQVAAGDCIANLANLCLDRALYRAVAQATSFALLHPLLGAFRIRHVGRKSECSCYCDVAGNHTLLATDGSKGVFGLPRITLYCES